MKDVLEGTVTPKRSNPNADRAHGGLTRREVIERIGKHAACTVPAVGVIAGCAATHPQRQVDRTDYGFRSRIGFDAGQNPIEGALAFAAENAFHYVDFNADRGANDLRKWDHNRVRAFRRICETNDLHVGVHTRSSVNVAEFAPFVSKAVDRYLMANVDLAVRLGCEWVIVHAGLHFSSAMEDRKAQGLARLKRLAAYAERKRARLLLENLNAEPKRAEVHYLASDVEECRYFFDAVPSEALGWAFTANHAHLVPEGIDGFLDAYGIERIGEVRLADNTGEYEVHLLPGDGTINFESLFRRIEGAGYRGHYSMAFGNNADKLAARDKFVAMLQ